MELYHKALRTTPSSAPTIVPQLQQVLTAAIYKRNAADLLDSATPTDLVRISSLTSPHAMAWLDGPGVLPPLSANEFRFALRYVMGLLLRNEVYICEECGRTGDFYGAHAVSCLRIGDIGRGHTCLKFALDQLLSHSGCTTVVKHPLPDARADHLKAMDIVITSGLSQSQVQSM